MPPVPYSDVLKIIADNDVQVFTESMNGKNVAVARLSFSTKIVDYLGSGKCIFAIGPENIAPIEYFKEEDAALIATNKDEMMKCLKMLLDDSVVREYAEKAVDCCKRNHDSSFMQNLIYSTLQNIAQ